MIDALFRLSLADHLLSVSQETEYARYAIEPSESPKRPFRHCMVRGANWRDDGAMRMRMLAIVAMVLSGSVANAAGVSVALAGSAPQAVRAAGSWGASLDVRTQSVQRWDVEALRTKDKQLQGRIIISGSSLFESANVQGRLSGRGVSGILLDDEGQELATFEGAVTPNGGYGTYRDRNGQTGEWQWSGSLQEEPLKTSP